MRNRNIVVLACFAVSLLIPLIAHAVKVEVRHDSITGRVFDSSTNAGVPGLTVRLIAPRAEKIPTKITVTTNTGDFQFRDLREGKYLLAIYRGTTLLFRKEINTSAETEFTVPLRPVAE